MIANLVRNLLVKGTVPFTKTLGRTRCRISADRSTPREATQSERGAICSSSRSGLRDQLAHASTFLDDSDDSTGISSFVDTCEAARFWVRQLMLLIDNDPGPAMATQSSGGRSAGSRS